MNILIATGKTGGHIYPALAIAKRLKYFRLNVIFVITGRKMENRIIKRNRYDRVNILAHEFPRKPSVNMISFILVNLCGILQAFYFILKFQPVAVIVTGGYSTFAIGVVAYLFTVPLIIQEQNIHPGLSNRLLSRFSSMVISPCMTRYFPARKTSVFPNPVRESILRTSREEALKHFGLNDDRVNLFITGGSQGAKKINDVLTNLLNSNGSTFENKFRFFFHTGQRFYHNVSKELVYKKQVILKGYFYNIHYVLACADIIISRAGAMTLAEITAKAIPSILIPFPYASEDHQIKNARYLEAKNCCFVIPQKKLTSSLLMKKLKELSDSNNRKEMSENLRKFFPYPADTDRKITDKILKLLNRRRSFFSQS